MKKYHHCVKFTYPLSFQTRIPKVDQHTGGKWLIHGTKHRKDNQLQSLATIMFLDLISEVTPCVTKETHTKICSTWKVNAVVNIFQLFNNVNHRVYWKKMYITFSSEGGCGDNHFGWVTISAGITWVGWAKQPMVMIANDGTARHCMSMSWLIQPSSLTIHWMKPVIIVVTTMKKFEVWVIFGAWLWNQTWFGNTALCILPYAVSKVLWRLC